MSFLKKFLSIVIAGCLCIFSLAGCSHRNASQAVNELRFSLDKISDVTISYDEERVTFLAAEGNDLVVREYMTENKDPYHAKVNQQGNQLHISEGGKPMFSSNFDRYIEVYLPSVSDGQI